MALSIMKNKAIISIFVLFLVLAFVLEVSEARRGGGGRGGGGRGRGKGRTGTKTTGSSGRGGTKPRNYNNVALSGRILKGSSPYTKSTWRKAAAAGLIFGGAIYLTRHRTTSMYNDRMPIICTNKRYRSPEGKRYDHFICPLPEQNATLKYCCGPEHQEYCCNKTTAQRYYAEHYNHKSGSSPVGMIVGLFVLIIIICILVYCFKKKGGGSISKMFKSKNRHRDSNDDINLNHTSHKHTSDPEEPVPMLPTSVPGSSPNGFHHANAPEQPPPYTASSSAAFDSGAGMPYAPPPPMPATYPGDPSVAPYPAGGIAPPYPPAPTPYPPPAGGAVNPPYSAAAPGAMDPPYPPTGPMGTPYGAPYPPSGGGTAPGAPPYPGGMAAPAPAYDSYAAYPPYDPMSHTKA